MRKSTFKYVESIIYHYLDDLRLIKQIETELIQRNAYHVFKDGMPGGKGGRCSSSVEKSVETFDKSRYLQTLREHTKAVKKVLDQSDEQTKQLIDKRYFKKKEWEHVSSDLYLSRSTCFRIRDKVVESLADEVGLV